MSCSTCVQILLNKITATSLVCLLVGSLTASSSWAETPSDLQAEPPEAEATRSAPTFQQIAQHRANAMARLDSLSHGIHNYRGVDCPAFPSSVFEGIGMSSGGTPGTCNNGGRVLADARAVSSSGRVYRVRFFTNNGGGSGGGRGWGRRGRRG